MMPPEPSATGEPPSPSLEPAGPRLEPQPVYRWYHKLRAILLIAFCLEIGLFLLIFPWTEFWQANYFGVLVPEWHRYWDNLYIRGAISGLGVLNVYISLSEISRLRRFSHR